MKQYTEEELHAINARDEAWLKKLPGVTGTGVGMDLQKGGQTSLKVFVNRLERETQTAIAQHYDNDVPVCIEAIGEVRPART